MRTVVCGYNLTVERESLSFMMMCQYQENECINLISCPNQKVVPHG